MRFQLLNILSLRSRRPGVSQIGVCYLTSSRCSTIASNNRDPRSKGMFRICNDDYINNNSLEKLKATEDALRPPMTIDDTKRILKLWKLEKAKLKLKLIEAETISIAHLLEIFQEEYCDETEAMEFAKMLDQAGNVIIVGNTVLLRPHQVMEAMESVLRQSSPESELKDKEKERAAINMAARKQVQRELLFGFGFLVAQTAACMRLTFWELSWDVMEPICFFLTSIYFISGYAFFLRTSKEPSFQGFYDARIAAKTSQLIKDRNLDSKP